jgi:hypothetical protein
MVRPRAEPLFLLLSRGRGTIEPAMVSGHVPEQAVAGLTLPGDCNHSVYSAQQIKTCHGECYAAELQSLRIPL